MKIISRVFLQIERFAIKVMKRLFVRKQSIWKRKIGKTDHGDETVIF